MKNCDKWPLSKTRVCKFDCFRHKGVNIGQSENENWKRLRLFSNTHQNCMVNFHPGRSIFWILKPEKIYRLGLPTLDSKWWQDQNGDKNFNTLSSIASPEQCGPKIIYWSNRSRAGSDTGSISKLCTTGMNEEFLSLLDNCRTQAKELNLANNLLIADMEKEMDWL